MTTDCLKLPRSRKFSNTKQDKRKKTAPRLTRVRLLGPKDEKESLKSSQK
jgi:hypothetical protein